VLLLWPKLFLIVGARLILSMYHSWRCLSFFLLAQESGQGKRGLPCKRKDVCRDRWKDKWRTIGLYIHLALLVVS